MSQRIETFADLAAALSLCDGRINLEWVVDDEEPANGAWCAHLSTPIKGARVSVEFGPTIPDAINAAFERHRAKIEKRTAEVAS